MESARPIARIYSSDASAKATGSSASVWSILRALEIWKRGVLPPLVPIWARMASPPLEVMVSQLVRRLEVVDIAFWSCVRASLVVSVVVGVVAWDGLGVDGRRRRRRAVEMTELEKKRERLIGFVVSVENGVFGVGEWDVGPRCIVFGG